MKIRSYQSGDEIAVIRLWRECGLVVPHNDPHRDIQRKLKVNPEWFLVGEIEGTIVASCMAGYEGHRGWINYLAVAPSEQRSGYARQMMQEAERLLRLAGCPKINLQVRATNDRVIEFYQSIGFKVDDVVSLGKRLEVDSPDNRVPVAGTGDPSFVAEGGLLPDAGDRARVKNRGVQIPSQIKAVIFDMDGVIIDTHDAFQRCILRWATGRGIALTKEKLMTWGSLSSVQFWTRMKAEYGLEQDIESLVSGYNKEDELREYFKIGLMTGLIDLLDRLRAQGIMTAVATSGRQYRVSHVMDGFNIRYRFDAIICNADVRYSKPDPEIYLLAGRRLDCEPGECLVIEDSANGIQAARSAGMTCFAHTRNGRNWEDLDGADLAFDSFADIVLEDMIRGRDTSTLRK